VEDLETQRWLWCDGWSRRIILARQTERDTLMLADRCGSFRRQRLSRIRTSVRCCHTSRSGRSNAPRFVATPPHVAKGRLATSWMRHSPGFSPYFLYSPGIIWGSKTAVFDGAHRKLLFRSLLGTTNKGGRVS
jgi:hypothetical protein